MLFRKAILIIHGFAGGTYDQENLAHYLELNKYFDVYQFTLPGHRNFSKVKYGDWIKKSEEEIEWLKEQGYKSIYLIGHSMGGVIATYLAAKYKEVKKLVLAAPAFQYLSIKKNDINLIDSIKTTPKIVKNYGGNEIISRISKLYPNAVLEFINLVNKYYDLPSNITCPLLIIQGKNDDLVPITSSKYIYDTANSSLKKIVFVEGLNHAVFESNKDKIIFEIVQKFLKSNEKGGEYNI